MVFLWPLKDAIFRSNVAFSENWASRAKKSLGIMHQAMWNSWCWRKASKVHEVVEWYLTINLKHRRAMCEALTHFGRGGFPARMRVLGLARKWTFGKNLPYKNDCFWKACLTSEKARILELFCSFWCNYSPIWFLVSPWKMPNSH